MPESLALRSAFVETEADEPTDPRTREVARRFRKVLEALGVDLGDPNLAGTELRVAKSYAELLGGLFEPEPELRTFPNTEGYREMVAVTGVSFHSLCAHHFLPFFGRAHVA